MLKVISKFGLEVVVEKTKMLVECETCPNQSLEELDSKE